MRGSDYAELRAFAVVAEHRSFARAAAQLGLSPSALSQTIRLLEQRIGVRLLNRTTRSVAPSQAGSRLLARLLPALGDLDAAVADVRTMRDSPSGLLRINTSHIAAAYVLAPLVGPFLEAYPDIVLDLVAEDRLVDIVAGQFDAGVRLGEMIERDMIAVRLGGDLRMVVVAAPAYLDRFGRPDSPRDLHRHRCVNGRWPTDQSVYRWEFERAGDRLEVATEGRLIVNDPDVMIRAACDGLGLAFVFEHQVRAMLATGGLVSLLDDWCPPFPGFFLYHPSRRHVPVPLRAFLDFLAEHGSRCLDTPAPRP